MLLIHCELLSVCGVRLGVQVQSLACGYSVAPAQFVERTILFPLNCPEIPVENQLITEVRVYF